MTACEVQERLKDRNFRLSLDFRPMTASDHMAFSGVGRASAEIAYCGEAAIIADYERGKYSVFVAA